MTSATDDVAVVAVTLHGSTVSVAVNATTGSVVVNLSTEDGEQVTLDSEKVERLRESMERLNTENIELHAKYDRMSRGYQETSQRDWRLFGEDRVKWEASARQMHEQRLSMARKFIDANARAYAAERRVRELEAKVETLEQCIDYGRDNPFKAQS